MVDSQLISLKTQYFFIEIIHNNLYFFSEQSSKRPGRYDEIPKSSTLENRQNIDQQFYATVQRYFSLAVTLCKGIDRRTIF